MIKNLINYLENKKILILGFGREGESTYKFIRKHLENKQIYIADKNEEALKQLKDDSLAFLISGDNYLDNLENYDLIIKTPGISFAHIETEKIESKITSQLELLLEFFNNFTIGVTGTKGKSTTSTLIYEILKNQNKKAMLLGNIGTPVFDYLDEIDEDTILVLEMSSHQLEFMHKSPNIAILLNIFEEHLDHYKSFEGYAEAKCKIFKNQNANDYYLYNIDNKTVACLSQNINAHKVKVSLAGQKESEIFLKDDEVYYYNKPIYNKNEHRNILGDHNLNNIMFVLGVSEILKLDLEKTKETISNFQTLRHRLEFVCEKDEIYYYDNSIATIPVATIEAVKALKNVDTLIIGGMDRGIDYTILIDFLNRSDITNIICMPKTGHDIAEKLTRGNIFKVETMEEAVAIAKEKTARKKACLLSPAAASYGYFKNFEERGDLFKKLVINN